MSRQTTAMNFLKVQGSCLTLKEIKETWHSDVMWEPWLGNWGILSTHEGHRAVRGRNRRPSWSCSSPKPRLNFLSLFVGFYKISRLACWTLKKNFKPWCFRSAVFTTHFVSSVDKKTPGVPDFKERVYLRPQKWQVIYSILKKIK